MQEIGAPRTPLALNSSKHSAFPFVRPAPLVGTAHSRATKRAVEIGQRGENMMSLAKKGLAKNMEAVQFYRISDQRNASNNIAKTE